MKIFDVHTHMQDRRYPNGHGEVIKRALDNSVVKIMSCGLYESDWDSVLNMSDEFSCIYPALGIHPWFVQARSSNWLDILEEKLLKSDASVGEIGIDNMVNKSDQEKREQEKVFVEQLKLAKRLNRAVNIHCRSAWGRLTEILDRVGLPDRGGVIHSYSGSSEMVKVLEKKGAYISFSGSVTKTNNKKVRKSLLAVSDDKLLMETDSPDITPAGIHGLNEPGYILETLKTISELKGKPESEIADITYRNSLKLFD